MHLRVLRRRLAPPDSAGFTLIEMVLSIAILGIVMVALVGAMFVTFRADADNGSRLDESADEQFAATYFGDDVQGAEQVTASSAPGCGTDPSAVVEFSGHDFDPMSLTTTATKATYVFRIVVSGGTTLGELHRLLCQGTTTPVSDQTVARTLATTVPAVTCAPSPCTAATSVSVVLTEASGWQYTLRGDRRTT